MIRGRNEIYISFALSFIEMMQDLTFPCMCLHAAILWYVRLIANPPEVAPKRSERCKRNDEAASIAMCLLENDRR